MTTTVRVVPAQDAAILRQYLTGSTSVVLVLDEAAQQALQAVNVNHGDNVDYNHGADPDINVDIVDAPDHYFVQTMVEESSES